MNYGECYTQVDCACSRSCRFLMLKFNVNKSGEF